MNCKYCGIDIVWNNVNDRWIPYESENNEMHLCEKSPLASRMKQIRKAQEKEIKKAYIANNQGKKYKWQKNIEIDKMDKEFNQKINDDKE
jgi:hypothetical protein